MKSKLLQISSDELELVIQNTADKLKEKTRGQVQIIRYHIFK